MAGYWHQPDTSAAWTGNEAAGLVHAGYPNHHHNILAASARIKIKIFRLNDLRIRCDNHGGMKLLAASLRAKVRADDPAVSTFGPRFCHVQMRAAVRRHWPSVGNGISSGTSFEISGGSIRRAA